MKIDDMKQAVAFRIVGRTDKAEPVEAQGEAAAKQQKSADKVELSSYMPVARASKSSEVMRVDRVEALKAQIASGSYQVSGRDIAEKMLSKLVLK